MHFNCAPYHKVNGFVIKNLSKVFLHFLHLINLQFTAINNNVALEMNSAAQKPDCGKQDGDKRFHL
jgi:hypothetical protein